VTDSIKKRLDALRPSLGAAKLVAVSKGHGGERMREALDAGQRIFGENRVQEAEAKWPELKAQYADVELHLIGPLQTNKVRDALAVFDVIHTLDRERLVDALAEAFAKGAQRVPCLIQVNTGLEEQKAGVAPEDVGALLGYARKAGVEVIGLMCIPPVDEEAAAHFALLRALAEKHGLQELSMGMSGDYREAVAEGATLVRIGTAIFGDRSI